MHHTIHFTHASWNQVHIFVSSREFTLFSSVIFTESDNRKMSSTRQVNVNASMIPATTAHVLRSVALFPPACEFKHKARVLTTVTARIQRLKTVEKSRAYSGCHNSLTVRYTFFSTMTTKRQTIKMKIISLNALKTVRLLSLMLFEELDSLLYGFHIFTQELLLGTARRMVS